MSPALTPSTDVLPEGSGWRVLPDPAPARERLWAPRLVRRSAVVPAWDAAAWEAAVNAAERVFGQTGLQADDQDARQWIAVRGWLRMETAWVPGGARLAVEREWRRSRPWLLALALLCLPTALAGAVLLSARTEPGDGWALVAALALVPVAGALWQGAWHWLRSLRALGQIRQVLAHAERAARHEAVVWAESEEWSPPVDPADPDDRPLLPVPRAAQWLSEDEVEGLLDARPAVAASADRRAARRVVERATAERRPPARRDEDPDGTPEGFAEWRP